MLIPALAVDLTLLLLVLIGAVKLAHLWEHVTPAIERAKRRRSARRRALYRERLQKELGGL